MKLDSKLASGSSKIEFGACALPGFEKTELRPNSLFGHFFVNLDFFSWILREKDNDLAVSAYKRWGFKNPTKKLIEVLNIWATFVYQPLLEDKIKPISEMPTGKYGRKTAEKVHKELRKIGGVKPPREFVLMDRAAVGLGSVFMHLKAEINWYRVFHELISDFDEKKLAAKQKNLLIKVGHKFK